MTQLSLLALPPGEDEPLGGESHHVRPTHLGVFDMAISKAYHYIDIDIHYMCVSLTSICWILQRGGSCIGVRLIDDSKAFM